MINAVTIGYRIFGHEGTFTHEGGWKSEAVAFDEAVEQLKVDLLVGVRVRAGESHQHYRDRLLSVVQLRPWAVRYSYNG